MKSVALVFMLSLAACGGDVFEAAPSTTSADAAGGDSKAEDAGAVGDADGGSSPFEDASSSDAGGADAHDAGKCTPFAPGETWTTEQPCAGNAVIVPNGHGELVLYQDDASQGQCVVRGTPTACRCIETFNCACLKANNGCEARTWIDCHEGPEGVAPTTTCR